MFLNTMRLLVTYVGQHFRKHLSEIRYKKGRPSSGPSRVEALEQLFNVDALNTEGGVQ
jgi:hypothetical protein